MGGDDGPPDRVALPRGRARLLHVLRAPQPSISSRHALPLADGRRGVECDVPFSACTRTRVEPDDDLVMPVCLCRFVAVFACLPLLVLLLPPPLPLLAKPPSKLLQGCSQELLHTQGFRQFTLMCRMQPPLAVVAYEGILDAMQQCREQMRFQPWDCSQPGTILHEPTILRYGYRESAYLLAMSSAGAAWGVATACAQGWLEECRCVQSKDARGHGDWEWGGCSYGVQFGIAASRKLLTRAGSARSPLRRVEKHNLKAGRLAVKKTLISSCKCHGVSGSCQQKTCWKKTSDMRAIAEYLTDKYRRARRVVLDHNKLKNAELIYLEPTPDNCAPQLEYQLQQRRSLPRICNWRNETHSEGDCGSLCCGRGYKVSHEVISYKCDCKFVWCCKLECNDCLQHRWVSTCNT